MMRGIKKVVIVLGVTAIMAPAVSWGADVLNKEPKFQSGPVAPKVVFRHDDSTGVDPLPPGRTPGIKPLPPPSLTSKTSAAGASRLGTTTGVASLGTATPQQKLESRLKNLALELR